MADCINALKAWTGKERATIIYDSTVDEFTDDGLFNKVVGSENIAVIGFTTDGDVFGGFYSVAMTNQDFLYDRNVFVFSFESHGRCETPHRFAVKRKLKDEAFVGLYKNVRNGLVLFGVFGHCLFYLGNEESNSYCRDLSQGFEGIQDTTLTGESSSWDDGPFHHCTRLVAVQLE